MLTFKDEGGFAFAEMLLAIVVQAFGFVAVAAVMGYGIQLQTHAGAASVGVNLAVAELERLRTLPLGSIERSSGGSLTANVANHFAMRGQTTVRWVVADGLGCGASTSGGAGAAVECTQNVTVSVVPPNAVAARATIMGMLFGG